MVTYTCQRCLKKFNHRGTYQRHLARKFPCKTPTEKMDSKFYCKQCNKTFSSNQSLKRHQKKSDCIRIQKLENQQEEMQKKFDLLLEEFRSKPPNTTYNIQNTYNVQINNFGYENTSYITDQMLLKLMQNPKVAVHELLRYIHFNPEHPENRNIRITNRKERFAHVFSNRSWQLAKKTDVLEKLVNKGYVLLDNCFEEAGKDALKPFRVEKYQQFQELMDELDSKMRKKVAEDTELLVLNNS